MRKRSLNILILAILGSFFYMSCSKDYRGRSDEYNELEAFLTANADKYPKSAKVDVENTFYYYINEKEGDGVIADSLDTVLVKYVGTFLNGAIFDSVVKRDPVKLVRSQVIRGWYEALGKMKKGGEAKLLIPSDLGYGSIGSGKVGEFQTLLFDIDLIDVIEHKKD